MPAPLSPPPLDSALVQNDGKLTSTWAKWLQLLWDSLRTEGWREVGAAGQPAFQNSWTNQGGGFRVARFRRAAGHVDIEGQVQNPSATGSVVFSLPEGYRPSATVEQISYSYDAGIQPSAVRIDANGDVTVHDGAKTFCSIHISFWTE